VEARNVTLLKQEQIQNHLAGMEDLPPELQSSLAEEAEAGT
jgi:hypothetical protein